MEGGGVKHPNALKANEIERHAPGSRVEVLHGRTGEWIAGGVVMMVFECLDFPGCRRYRQYEIEGYDKDGPFHGRFDEDHVRPAPADGAGGSHSNPAGGKIKAKPAVRE